MTTISCTYTGDGTTQLVHGPTGEKIQTDLPPDNGGQGRKFSPTDLLAGAFAACILTIMSSTSEICAIVDAAIAGRYDGSRGKTISKWFFYIFYPAHLFILFLIRYTIFP